MLKYFSLLIDLLEIPNIDKYILVAEQIEKTPQLKLEVYHRHSFIFLWFQKLVNQEIQIEEFVSLWDLNSEKLDTLNLDSIVFSKALKYTIDQGIFQKEYTGSLIILDEFIQTKFTEEMKNKDFTAKVFFC